MYSFPKVRARAGITGLTAALAFFGLLSSPLGFNGVPRALAQSAPDLSIRDASVSEGSELVFVLDVTTPHPALTVDYATRDGLALAGDDYTSASGTLTIPRDAATAEIRVRTTRERVFEPDESVFVDLSNSIANIVDAEAEGTILNEDPVPSIRIDDTSVTEIDDSLGTVEAVFNVRLSNPASQPVTVRFRTDDASATGSDPFTFQLDFRDARGELEFPAGDNTTQQIRVDVKGDRLHEGDETFLVNLSNAVNALIRDGQATGTIVDQDGVPTLSIEASKVSAEGDSGPRIVSLNATLSNPTVHEVTFTASTSNGSAVTPGDYTEVVDRVEVIEALQTSESILLTVSGDNFFEADENLFVIIDNPTNAVLGNSVGEVTLTNDDTIIIINPTPITLP